MPNIRHFFSTPVAALALTAAVPALAGASIGPTSPGGSVDSNAAGTAQDYRSAATATESINRLSIYLDAKSTASKVELGLYNNSGALLGRCVVAAPQAGAWNRCTIPAASVTKGTNYWTSVLQPAGTTGKVSYRTAFGSGSSYGSKSTTLSALPATWANGSNWGAQTASVLADNLPSSAPAAPTATYAVTPSAPVTGSATSFDAAGSGCASGPCSYTWEDDGSDGAGGTQWPLGSGKQLSFTFQEKGVKNVRLTVTDALGRKASTVKAITVNAPSTTPTPTPTPDPTPTPTPDPTPTPTPDPTPTPTPSPSACTMNATTANFASQFSAAGPGAVICLAAGNYGSFSGAAKSGAVTIQPASGATATLSVNFNGAANLNLVGLTISSATLQGSTKNVTIANSTFTGDTVIRPSSMTNANIVLNGNTHNNITPSGAYEGRISLTSGGNPSGVTIENSLFSGGLSDGIQNGSTGTKILNNEFVNIHQGDPNIAHTDALQLYGSKQTVVQGNYFHSVEDCIMAPDGTDHETITDNVCVTDGSQNGFTIGADTGSVISHNTFGANGLRLYGGNQNRASSGTTVMDNILSGGDTITGSGLNVDYNLSPSTTTGSHAIKGSPTYAGGSRPTTMAGFALAAGSLGKGNASDGKDRGARF